MQFRTKNCLFLAMLLVAAGRLFELKAFQQRTEAVKSGVVAARSLSQYVLGPNDVITIMAADWDEVANKPIRIGTGGDIALTMAGRIHAAGMTVSEFEEELIGRMKKFIKNPDISVTVTEFKSQPVTVTGLVGRPGPVQLEGRKTLLEVISQAGDLQPEASSKVTIIRKKEWGPLPFSQTSADGATTTTQINLNSIRDASEPEKNIQIMPEDIISARRAPIVYAVGQFTMQGRFLLSDRESVSVLQLLGMAGGTTITANTKKASIIRPDPGSIRTEVLVNLEDIKKGKAKDIVLRADDILFVPENHAKRLFLSSLDTVVNTATTLPLYRF